MKPRNFPGRVNARRKRALARIPFDGPGMDALVQSVEPDSVARAKRTKKYRESARNAFK